MAALIVERHPEYAEDIKLTFLQRSSTSFCNMYIMHQNSLIKPPHSMELHLLTVDCPYADMSTYSKEGLRTPGHLTERLTYLAHMHMLRVKGKNWKVRAAVHSLY